MNAYFSYSNIDDIAENAITTLYLDNLNIKVASVDSKTPPTIHRGVTCSEALIHRPETPVGSYTLPQQKEMVPGHIDKIKLLPVNLCQPNLKLEDLETSKVAVKQKYFKN